MSLVDVVVLAAVQGAAEVLPISGTGHGAVARLWLGADPRGALAMAGSLHLAAAAALAIALRRRLGLALDEGVRAIARPALFRASPDARDAALILVGGAVSIAAATALRPYVELWSQAPIALGLGLLATGAALASAALAPTPSRILRSRYGARPPAAAEGRPSRGDGAARGGGPSLAGMLAVGFVHGIAAAPGMSRIGAALVLLLWLGVRPARAVDLSLLISVPALLAAGLRGSAAPGSPLAPDLLVAGLLIAFLSASAAAAALRWLAERRRVGVLALWVIPLGLATIAYARALPGFA